MTISRGWTISVQQFHLRPGLTRSPAARGGCLPPFALIGLLRVPRRPFISRFLASKSQDATTLLDCLRRLHAEALGADKQSLDLCKVIDGPGGLENYLQAHRDFLTVLEREPGVTAEDIVAALLDESSERGADTASVSTEPVGPPNLTDFSEAVPWPPAPNPPTTSGQGLGGLLALAIGEVGDQPLVMISAEAERYPGQLLGETPSEWGARAEEVLKEVLRRIELGVIRRDGCFEYSMTLFSSSSPVKMLSSYLRKAFGLRETKGRAGLVSVLTRVVHAQFFTSDQGVLDTLPEAVRPKIRTHSRWNERIDRLRRDIREAKRRLALMDGLLKLETPAPTQLGEPQHIGLPLNVRVRCWGNVPELDLGPARLVVSLADEPPVFKGDSPSPGRAFADVTWLGGGRALVENGDAGAGTAIDGSLIPAGEASILCQGSRLTLGMTLPADAPRQGGPTPSGFVYQLCTEDDTVPSLPRPPTEAERHTGGGEPSSTDRDGPSGSGDFCAQCSLNGDPRGVRVRDNYKCLGSNSQCERRCNCKDTFAHGNFLCITCDRRFCLAHCARGAHYCAPPPEIPPHSRGEKESPMLATPAEGADGAPARTKQRGSSAEAACDAERLRREHDVVYLRSWPSLQQGPPDKRPKLLSLAERRPSEGEAGGVGRVAPIAAASPLALADGSPGRSGSGAEAREPSESSSQDELEIVEEEIREEEAMEAPGGLAAAGAGAYHVPTPRSTPHATPSPLPHEGGAEVVGSSSEGELEIVEETVEEALGGRVIAGSAARRIPLSHFIPSAPPNPRPRDPPPPETIGSRGPSMRSASLPPAPSQPTAGAVMDLALVRGTGRRGCDPLAALMRPRGEAGDVGRVAPIAAASPLALADGSPGRSGSGAEAREPSESSSQDELEIVEEEIREEEAMEAPGGLAAAGAGAYHVPTPRSTPHATPSPLPHEGGAEVVGSSSEGELEIVEETVEEALGGRVIAGSAARRIPLSHFIPSAPPNPRPRDPPPPETIGSRGPSMRSASLPPAPSQPTAGAVMDLALVRGTGRRGCDPLAALMRPRPLQPGLQRPLSPPERHAGGGEPSSTDKDGPGNPEARASDAHYLAGTPRPKRQRPPSPTERHAGGGEPSSTDKDGPSNSETRASGAPCHEQTAATGAPDERARRNDAARRRSASQAAAAALASGPGLTAAQYKPFFCEWACHAPGWIITAMQRWARRGKYRDLTSDTPWHPVRPKPYPPPSAELWTSSLWYSPGRVITLAERCTAGIPVPAGLALAHACAISAACGQDLISCLTILVTAVQRDSALQSRAARVVEQTGGGEPDATWRDVGRTDLRMADWRDEGPGCFLTAQPDGGQEHLTARRRRRRGPGENPAPRTEAFDAMLPWCSPNGLAEERLLGILGGMVGVLDEGHGEGPLADLSLLFGYEPTAEVRSIAVASADILERFCLHMPSYLGRNSDGYKWAASLPRRGRVPAYLEIASSDVHLSSFLGLNGLVSLASDEGDRYHEDTLRYVNICVSTVAVRWANWVVDPENEKLKGIHHLLLLAVKYLQLKEHETLDGIELENLITVLHSMYVSTEDTNYKCSQAKRRVTDHMVMWLACDPMAHVPITEKDCWATACATLYRIEAMRRLGHADRARLAALITALISRLPRGMLRSELYPAYAADPAPLLQPPRRGGWDKESGAGDSSAPATSMQDEVAGPLGETGASSGPTAGTSTQSGVAGPPEEPPGGPPGKRQRLGDSLGHYHLGELRPMELPPRGPWDESKGHPPGSMPNASRYLNEGRDLVISGRVWHLARIAAHLGVPLKGPCWPFLLSSCEDQNRPSRCKHWGQRNHESATSAAHRLKLPPGMSFDRDSLSASQRFSRPATKEERAGIHKMLGRGHESRHGRDGLQRPLTPTERYAGGGEPSSTDKDGPRSPGGSAVRACAAAAEAAAAASASACPSTESSAALLNPRTGASDAHYLAGSSETRASDEQEGETPGQDVTLGEAETLRLEMRAAVVTLLVFGRPGDVSKVDELKPASMKRARAALRSHGVQCDAWDPPMQRAGAWVAEYVSPPRDPSIVRYVADDPLRRHALGLIRDRLLRVAGARDAVDSMGNYEVFITFLGDAANVYLRAVREGRQLFEDNGGDHDDADHSAVLLEPVVPEELVVLVPLRPLPATADELAASFAALPLDERPPLPDDVWDLIVSVLLSALEPCPVVRFSGTCKMLRALLPPPTRQRLQTDHERATALCLKMGLQSSKELREAAGVRLHHRSLTADDLASLAALSLDLPVLDYLILDELIQNHYERPDVVGKFLRLVEGLREGALRSLTMFCIEGVHVGDTGASELADALDRGAMPRLQGLGLVQAAIKDATLAILTPALRRRPALERLYLDRNPITAEGVKALVAGFARLHTLYISGGRSITSDGRDSLVAALAGGALPKLVRLKVEGFGEVAPRLGCGWRVAMSPEHPSLWEITHPPPGGSRAPFVLDIPPRWAAVPSPVLPS